MNEKARPNKAGFFASGRTTTPGSSPASARSATNKMQKTSLRHTPYQQLTPEQISLSSRADAAGISFDDVQPKDLFGPQANSMTAARVFACNPVAYRRKRLEYGRSIGEIPTPLPEVPEA